MSSDWLCKESVVEVETMEEGVEIGDSSESKRRKSGRRIQNNQGTEAKGERG